MDYSAFAHLPHNRAAENNKQAIGEQLNALGLLSHKRVFEVGSGTGQHGVQFVHQAKLSNIPLHWQLSEQPGRLDILLQWHQAAQQQGLANLFEPVAYDVLDHRLPTLEFDYLYAANVLHIISTEMAKRFIKQSTEQMKQGQQMVFYGPFKLNGEFTTTSNADFHHWLIDQGYGGLNDIEDIISWSGNRLKLEHQIPMPANNFLLVYEKHKDE